MRSLLVAMQHADVRQIEEVITKARSPHYENQAMIAYHSGIIRIEWSQDGITPGWIRVTNRRGSPRVFHARLASDCYAYVLGLIESENR